MAKRIRQQEALSNLPGILPVALGMLALVLVAAGLALGVGTADQLGATAATPKAVDSCRTTPQFVARVATAPNVALATDSREMGLVLRAASGNTPAYQDPSWDDAGYLGAIAYDRKGNVYAAPTPRLSLRDNPLAGAATIWRADTTTGKLQPFVSLPGNASERNPFGVLGLFYACDLDTLYAGSVLGSTPTQEHGGVIAMHLSDGAQTTLLESTDVMGVLVVRQGSGYTLYAGLARQPTVIALPLDAQGRASGPPTTLLNLNEAGATPQERVRKLRLIDNELVADLVPFTFSLQINATDIPQVRQARWIWNPSANTWVLRRRVGA